jgi:hypothetical protein
MKLPSGFGIQKSVRVACTALVGSLRPNHPAALPLPAPTR